MKNSDSPVNGVLVADKPAGCTSHDVVVMARRKLRTKKIGHLGTLDPIATGCLPLCIGRATRLSPWLGKGLKKYEGVFRLGLETDTYDIAGKQLAPPSDPSLPRAQIEQAASGFVGELDQLPPLYSAKKSGGVPLYKHARQGRTPHRSPVRIRVYRFRILDVSGPEVSFDVECGPGTYVRALAHDLGRSLDVGATLISLRRLQSGDFSVDQALELKKTHWESLMEAIVPMSSLLPGLVALTVSEGQVWQVKNGQDIALPAGLDVQAAGEIRILSPDGDLLGIGEVRETDGLSQLQIHPRVVLP